MGGVLCTICLLLAEVEQRRHKKTGGAGCLQGGVSGILQEDTPHHAALCVRVSCQILQPQDTDHLCLGTKVPHSQNAGGASPPACETAGGKERGESRGGGGRGEWGGEWDKGRERQTVGEE